jgi:hypothetical protein
MVTSALILTAPKPDEQPLHFTSWTRRLRASKQVIIMLGRLGSVRKVGFV